MMVKAQLALPPTGSGFVALGVAEFLWLKPIAIGLKLKESPVKV
jgi:hypothetical protein